jgi:pimeloyl-ACP methyl ester carboxylesterase
MTSALATLGTWFDTWNGTAKMKAFRTGWPATASEGVHFHRVGKVQFRYLVAGAGRTIVFSVDGPMTIETYGALVDVFAPPFRVVVVEMPAMGFSAVAPGFSFAFPNVNVDLAAFVREVCGPQSILAFSCVVGLAALDIAVRAPDLVSHLCLIQTASVATFQRWKAGRDPKGVLARPVVGQLVMKKIAPKRMPDWYQLTVGRRDRIAHVCACAERSFAHGAQWTLASAFQIYMDLTEELPQPTQPILSIWGNADGSHLAENRHSLSQVYSNVACVSFPDLGHTPELEEPERVLAAIQDFLRKG